MNLQPTHVAAALFALGPIVQVAALMLTPTEARVEHAFRGVVVAGLTGLVGTGLWWKRRDFGKYFVDIAALLSLVVASIGSYVTNDPTRPVGRLDVTAIYAGLIVIVHLALRFRRAIVHHALCLISMGIGTFWRVDNPRVLLGSFVVRVFWFSAAGFVVARQRANRESLIRNLRADSLVDRLSGIANRTAFVRQVELALDGVKRGRTPTVLLLDLDNFKEVNDTLGHGAGDIVLTEVGRRLRAIEQKYRGVHVARLGGDEFGVALEDAEPEDATAVAKEIVGSLRQPMEVERIEISIDASIGLAAAPRHGTNVSELLRNADAAMYGAKSSKNGPVWCVAQNAGDTPRSRLVLLGELRRAIATDELKLYYQPKVKLENRAMHGVEALVRWPHATYGFVSPAEFIAAAEQTGLIHDLTDWVLKTAIRQCREWLESGLELRVAVNVSTRNLLEPNFAERVRSMLAAYRLRGEYIVLEITEGTLMQNPEQGREAIAKLKALGVEIALDDFGTGFSSLFYLNQLSVDEIKVDRAFLSGIEHPNSVNRAIIRSTVALGRDLKVRVVVEGVEKDEEVEILRSLGADIGQGYLFSRPVPADDISAMVTRKLRFNTAPRPGQPAPTPVAAAAR